MGSSLGPTDLQHEVAPLHPMLRTHLSCSFPQLLNTPSYWLLKPPCTFSPLCWGTETPSCPPISIEQWKLAFDTPFPSLPCNCVLAHGMGAEVERATSYSCPWKEGTCLPPTCPFPLAGIQTWWSGTTQTDEGRASGTVGHQEGGGLGP